MNSFWLGTAPSLRVGSVTEYLQLSGSPAASLHCYKQQQTDSTVEERVIEGEETQTHTDTEKMTS